MQSHHQTWAQAAPSVTGIPLKGTHGQVKSDKIKQDTGNKKKSKTRQVQELPIYFLVYQKVLFLPFFPPRFPAQFANLSVLLLLSLVIMKELHLCSMKPAQPVPPHSTCQEEGFDLAGEKMDLLDAPLIALSTLQPGVCSPGNSYRSSTKH